MTMTPSPSDLPTLRLQLDKVLTDHTEFSKGFQTKQQQFDQIVREVEQYRGALHYISVMKERLEKEIAAISPPSA